MLLQLLSFSGMLLFTGTTFAEPSHPTKKHVPNQVIVTFENNLSPSEQEAIVTTYGGKILHRFQSSPSVLVQTMRNEAEFLADVDSLKGQGEIRKVGLNRLFHPLITPNDPKLDQQYHHRNIETAKAWDITTGSRSVVVAVIDTGVDYKHPDLVENMWSNAGETGKDANGRDKSNNGLDDDGNGYVDDFRGWDFAANDNDPMDGHGHGTHCAGGIGAVGNNGQGVSGLNWNVTVMPLRFIGDNGQGSEADAVKAIEYATKMGVTISSNSWGGDPEEATDPDILEAAIKAANDAGMLFVAAAGNDGRNTDSQPTLPASYELDNILSVAASNQRDNLTSFSNFGTKTVDLAAPGEGIFSTIKRGWFGRAYGSMSGTSMACPLVAGAAALIKSQYPDATPAEIKDRILRSVDQIDSLKGKVSTGGRLNVFRALQ